MSSLVIAMRRGREAASGNEYSRISRDPGSTRATFWGKRRKQLDFARPGIEPSDAIGILGRKPQDAGKRRALDIPTDPPSVK
jgi:hypothetical protein